MKKRILVTGVSGFIGQHLLFRLLKQNDAVYGILRKSKKNKKFANKVVYKHKNFYPIFFKKINELNFKLKKIKVNILINLATQYLKDHKFSEMIKLINSNILFTTAVIEALPKNNMRKFINLSSMMLHNNSKNYEPQNLYSATKKAFIDILRFYEIKYKNIKFFNLTIYDTFGLNDKRIKVIPEIIKKYKLNKIVKIYSKKLELNLLSVNDVCQGIEILIKKPIPAGQYKIMSKKFTNIEKLIIKTNKKLKRKIKYRITNQKVNKRILTNTKNLPFWKQRYNIESNILNYINESNKN